MTKLIKKHQNGGTVSDLYEQKTGKKWSSAKQEGLTSGSYEDNMKLKRRLLSGEFDSNEVNNSIENAKKATSVESTHTEMPVDEGVSKYLKPSSDYSSARSFQDAFSKARRELGSGKTFKYNGKTYTTNTSDEINNVSTSRLISKNYSLPKNRKEIFKFIMDNQQLPQSTLVNKENKELPKNRKEIFKFIMDNQQNSQLPQNLPNQQPKPPVYILKDYQMSGEQLRNKYPILKDIYYLYNGDVSSLYKEFKNEVN